MSSPHIRCDTNRVTASLTCAKNNAIPIVSPASNTFIPSFRAVTSGAIPSFTCYKNGVIPSFTAAKRVVILSATEAEDEAKLPIAGFQRSEGSSRSLSSEKTGSKSNKPRPPFTLLLRTEGGIVKSEDIDCPFFLPNALEDWI